MNGPTTANRSTAGADLFSDSENFMDFVMDLSAQDELSLMGGGGSGSGHGSGHGGGHGKGGGGGKGGKGGGKGSPGKGSYGGSYSGSYSYH